MKKVNFSFSFFITGMLHHLIALSTFIQQVPSKLKQIGKSVIHCVHNFRELCKVYRCWQPGTMQAPQWGEKAEKRGEIGKIAVSEASLVVGRTTTYLAGFTRRFFFFFFLPTPIFFSFSPNAEPGPRLRGWLYLQGSTFGVSTGNGVYTMVPDVLSVTIAC